MPRNRHFFWPHLTILDRYLLRELILNLLAITAVLWLIYLATRFSRYLAQAAAGHLPGDVIVTLLGYSSVSVLALLLPVATFLAVMLVLGRLNADNELTVIFCCGISDTRILRTITLFSSSIAVIIALLSLWIAPAILADDYQLEKKAKMSADTTGLIAGKFKESQQGNWTFYSRAISADKQEMQDIFIQINRRPRPLIFRAERGYFDIDPDTGNKYLILKNGYRYEGQAGEKDWVIARYQQHDILVEKGDEQHVKAQRYKTLPTTLLWQRGKPRDLAEIEWRAALAVMPVILSLLALPLVTQGPRKSRYAGFFSAVLLYLLYSNLLGISKAWVSKSLINPWVGAVGVHVLMLMLFVLMRYRHKIVQWWHARRGVLS